MMDDGMGVNNSRRSMTREVEDGMKKIETEQNASPPRRELKDNTMERLV